MLSSSVEEEDLVGEELIEGRRRSARSSGSDSVEKERGSI